MDNVKHELFNAGNNLVLLLTMFIDRVRKEKQTNEQWFLNFMDEINKQSVRY
jgi:hypothetical protein